MKPVKSDKLEPSRRRHGVPRVFLRLLSASFGVLSAGAKRRSINLAQIPTIFRLPVGPFVKIDCDSVPINGPVKLEDFVQTKIQIRLTPDSDCFPFENSRIFFRCFRD